MVSPEERWRSEEWANSAEDQCPYQAVLSGPGLLYC